jgi:hypothetical protein
MITRMFNKVCCGVALAITLIALAAYFLADKIKRI